MSVAKIGLLVVYLVLAALALTQGDAPAGVWAARLLGILALVHLVEVVVFFKACQRAGGSLAGHLVNVFLFGVLHMKEVKAAQSDQ